MRKLLFIGLLLLTSKGAQAQVDGSARGVVSPSIGTGTRDLTCGDYVRARSGVPDGKIATYDYGTTRFYGESLAYSEYVSGFVSGVNLAQPDPKRQISGNMNDIEMTLSNTCRAQPTLLFITALWNLARRFGVEVH